MNTDNETAPVHIDAFICTSTLLIRTSCLSFLFLFCFVVSRLKKEEEAACPNG